MLRKCTTSYLSKRYQDEETLFIITKIRHESSRLKCIKEIKYLLPWHGCIRKIKRSLPKNINASNLLLFSFLSSPMFSIVFEYYI